MFASFSWVNYFLFVGFLLFVYFIIIGVTCYKKEIIRFFGKKDLMQAAVDAPVSKTPELLPMVHELVSELGVVIRNARENKTVLPELLVALKEKIKDFSLLQYSAYKAKINLYIAQEIEILGYHNVREEEVEQLWHTS